MLYIIHASGLLPVSLSSKIVYFQLRLTKSSLTAALQARQDKEITSFQPAWLIECSTQHQGQFPASSSRLHPR